jgi:orotidine-5'-phosphate decarboxylase
MKERIIVALDTDSPEKALSTVGSLSGEVGLCKVGMELFPRGGPELVRPLRNEGYGVFLDLKFHDIPNTVAGAVRSAADWGSGSPPCTPPAAGPCSRRRRRRRRGPGRRSSP